MSFFALHECIKGRLSFMNMNYFKSCFQKLQLLICVKLNSVFQEEFGFSMVVNMKSTPLKPFSLISVLLVVHESEQLFVDSLRVGLRTFVANSHGCQKRSRPHISSHIFQFPGSQ